LTGNIRVDGIVRTEEWILSGDVKPKGGEAQENERSKERTSTGGHTFDLVNDRSSQEKKRLKEYGSGKKVLNVRQVESPIASINAK